MSLRTAASVLLPLLCLVSLALAAEIEAEDQVMVLDASSPCGCQACPCPTSCGCNACPCQNQYIKPEVVNKLAPRCDSPSGCPGSEKVSSRVPGCGCTTCPCSQQELRVKPLVVKSLDAFAANGTVGDPASNSPQPPAPTQAPVVTPAAPTVPATDAAAAAPASGPATRFKHVGSAAATESRPVHPKVAAALSALKTQLAAVQKALGMQPPAKDPAAAALEAKKAKARAHKHKADKQFAEDNADGADTAKPLKKKHKKHRHHKKRHHKKHRTNPVHAAQDAAARRHAEDKDKKADDRLIAQQESDRKYKMQREAARLSGRLDAVLSGKATNTPPPPPQPNSGAIRLEKHQNKFGLAFLEPGFYRVGKFCVLVGLAKIAQTDDNPNFNIGSLPRNCRPENSIAVNQHQSFVTASRLEITGSGKINLKAQKNLQNDWLSLSGTVILANYSSDPNEPYSTTPLTLTNGWTKFRSDHLGPPAIVKDGEFCAMTGAVMGDEVMDWKASPILTVPEWCRPKTGRVIFLQNQHTHAHRVDVLPNGQVKWVSGNNQKLKWLSLDGMLWSNKADVSGVREIELMHGWQHWSNGYKRASYSVQNGLCVVGGVVRNAGNDGDFEPLMKLPAACRPAGRLIFATASHHQAARFDVFASGEVRLIDILSRPTVSTSLVETQTNSKAKWWWWWWHRHWAEQNHKREQNAKWWNNWHRQQEQNRKREQTNKWHQEQHGKRVAEANNKAHQRAVENNNKAEAHRRHLREVAAKAAAAAEARQKYIRAGQIEHATKKYHQEQNDKARAAHMRRQEQGDKQRLRQQREQLRKAAERTRKEEARKSDARTRAARRALEEQNKVREADQKKADRRRAQAVQATERMRLERARKADADEHQKKAEVKTKKLAEEALKHAKELTAKGRITESEKAARREEAYKAQDHKAAAAEAEKKSAFRRDIARLHAIQKKAEATKKKTEQTNKAASRAARKERQVARKQNHAAEILQKAKLRQEIDQARATSKVSIASLRASWASKIKVVQKEVAAAKKSYLHSQFHKEKASAQSAEALKMLQSVAREEARKARKANKAFEQDSKRSRAVLTKSILAAKRDQGRAMEEKIKEHEKNEIARNKERKQREKVLARKAKIEQSEKHAQQVALAKRIQVLKSQGKIDEANAEEAKAKMAAAKSEKQQREHFRRAKQREEKRKRHQQEGKFQPAAIEHPPAPSVDQVKAGTKATAPRALPRLQPVWWSLDGIRFPPASNDQ